MLTIISLGAGVQSTTMALMAARGEIGPMPDCAIFADTGWEPQAVYDHLAWLSSPNVLSFPVKIVRRDGPDLGELSIQIATSDVTRSAMPPWYTAEPHGMLPRQCSKEFKTRAIAKEIRTMLGLKRGERGPNAVAVEQWLGISQDEMQRMKDPEQKFIKNRWPLVEKGMDRNACLRWMERAGYPRPPKSACIFCPYMDNARWRTMKDESPDDWNRAVAFDSAIRPGFVGMVGEAFVHKQRVPLGQVDLTTLEDHGQLNMFNNECEGMCGV